MANPYTQPTLSGYNSSPPADDGTTVATNEVKWATHTGKIGDPLKTFAEAVDTNVLAAFATVFLTTENVFNDAGADIDFRVEGNGDANLLFCDAGNDRVGVGIATPDGKLHVHTATAGVVTAGVSADDLVVENSGDCGITLFTPNANISRIVFGTPTDSFSADLQHDYTNNLFSIRTGGANMAMALLTANVVEAVRIDKNQDVHIGGTNPQSRLHVTDSATNLAFLESTDVGAGIGPVLTLWRNSASPAVDDSLGAIEFMGEESGGFVEVYARIQVQLIDPTSANPDGELVFQTDVAGTTADRVLIRQGMYMAGTTGGDKGADTINATSYYVAGTVGADYGPADATSFTVVKGIVTAIS